MSSSQQIAVDEVVSSTDNGSKSVRQPSVVSVSSAVNAPSSSKTKMWQNAIAPDVVPVVQPVQLTPVQACLQNKAIIAVAVGLLTAFLLAVVNPPMAQEKSVNDIIGPCCKQVLSLKYCLTENYLINKFIRY